MDQGNIFNALRLPGNELVASGLVKFPIREPRNSESPGENKAVLSDTLCFSGKVTEKDEKIVDLRKAGQVLMKKGKKIRVAWEFSSRDYINGPRYIMACSGGTISYSTTVGRVCALDAKTGALKWEYSQKSMVFSPPAVGEDSTLYFGSDNNFLYAINSNDGRLKWKYRATGPVQFEPVTSKDGAVYFVCGDKLYAVDEKTHKKKWCYKAGDAVSAPPAVGPDGTLFVPARDCTITAVDKDTGKPVWKAEGTNYSDYSPVVDNNNYVYFSNDEGEIFCLDGSTGRWKWKYSDIKGAYISSAPALSDDGVLFVGDNRGVLTAIDCSTGRKKWEFKTGGRIFSTPALDGKGNVLFGSDDGHLYVLNQDTGKLKFKYNAGFEVTYRVLPQDGGIACITSNTGKLQAIIYDFESRVNGNEENSQDGGKLGAVQGIIKENDVVNIGGVKLPVRKKE